MQRANRMMLAHGHAQPVAFGRFADLGRSRAAVCTCSHRCHPYNTIHTGHGTVTSHHLVAVPSSLAARRAWPQPQFAPQRLASTKAAPEGSAGTESLSSLKRKIAEADSRLHQVLAVADLKGTMAKLASLENDAADASLWTDASKAQAILGAVANLRSEVAEIEGCSSQLAEAAFAVELLEATDDAAASEEASIIREALGVLQRLNVALDRWELRRLLSGPYDERGARLVVTAGAGGVDAMDWAQMLERMYTRWAEARGFTARMIDRSVGEEAGIKSVELEIEGRHVYGYLRSEKGTHRLVRNSPFNAKGLRQTSFAGVDVMPILDASTLPVDLDLKDSDLEWSTMRASGKGGQNVNKVESGVRVVHIPTGLAVKCIQERNQMQNRAIALDILKSRLLVVLEEQNAKRLAEIRGDLVKAEWGTQIRNYVVHPYRLVKDTRTGWETSDLESVLDGELDECMAAHLRMRGSQATSDSLTQQPGQTSTGAVDGPASA